MLGCIPLFKAEESVADLESLAKKNSIIMSKGMENKKASISNVDEEPNFVLKSPPLEGFLMKKGAKGISKAYKRRYFILKTDKLYYYKSQHDCNPGSERGFINLQRGNFDLNTYPIGSHHFDIRQEHRLWQLQAESEEEVDFWVSGLTKLKEKLIHENCSPITRYSSFISMMKQGNEEEVKELKEMITDVEAELEEKNLKISELNAELQESIRVIKQKSSRINDLDKEVEELRNGMNQLIANFNKEKENMLIQIELGAKKGINEHTENKSTTQPIPEEDPLVTEDISSNLEEEQQHGFQLSKPGKEHKCRHTVQAIQREKLRYREANDGTVGDGMTTSGSPHVFRVLELDCSRCRSSSNGSTVSDNDGDSYDLTYPDGIIIPFPVAPLNKNNGNSSLSSCIASSPLSIASYTNTLASSDNKNTNFSSSHPSNTPSNLLLEIEIRRLNEEIKLAASDIATKEKELQKSHNREELLRKILDEMIEDYKNQLPAKSAVDNNNNTANNTNNPANAANAPGANPANGNSAANASLVDKEEGSGNMEEISNDVNNTNDALFDVSMSDQVDWFVIENLLKLYRKVKQGEENISISTIDEYVKYAKVVKAKQKNTQNNLNSREKRTSLFMIRGRPFG